MAVDLTREPVTLDQAKRHLGVRLPARDDEIAGLIVAARQRIETYTFRSLSRRVFTQAVDKIEPGAPMLFDFGPVHRVRAVRYLTSDGDLVDAGGVFRALGPIGNRWRLWTSGGVPLSSAAYAEIEYEAGFGPRITEDGGSAPVEAPAELVRAMLLLIGLWFENHEADVIGTTVIELPHGVRDICRDYRPGGVA